MQDGTSLVTCGSVSASECVFETHPELLKLERVRIESATAMRGLRVERRHFERLCS